jgi:hypothetical protein
MTDVVNKHDLYSSAKLSITLMGLDSRGNRSIRPTTVAFPWAFQIRDNGEGALCQCIKIKSLLVVNFRNCLPIGFKLWLLGCALHPNH